MPILEEITGLVLNKVDSMDTFRKMIAAGVVKDNELYLVLEEEDYEKNMGEGYIG